VDGPDVPAELARLEEANEKHLERTPVPFDLEVLHDWLDGRVALSFARADEFGTARADEFGTARADEFGAAVADPAAGSADPDADADTPAGESEAGSPRLLVRSDLPEDEPLEGVVLEVDGDAQTARIGFGADLAGSVRLDDVEWARKPDPTVYPRPVRKIQRIFRVGDVARFVRLPDDAGGDDGEAEGTPIARLDIWQEPLAEGALLSIENDTGDVLAMVGGYDFSRSEFNRAVQAQRQPGSAFKPFIYGAALTRGYTPVSQVVDRPVVYTDPVSGFVWAPRNYGRKFYGPMTMRNALKKSINNATVHLFRDLGVRYVIDYARRMGIESPLSPDLSLALGSSSLTLLELTRAYAIYPRGGKRVIPRFILRVTDREGNELLGEVPLGDVPPTVEPLPSDDETQEASHPDAEAPTKTTEVISPANAYLMCDLLRAVVQEGTGRGLRYIGRTIAGKTGTTNDFTDAWFMGFSPDVTTGVWVGHDDNETLGWGESGGHAALPIWGNYMKVALAPYPRRDFEVPDHIEFLRIDKDSGLLAEAQTEDAYFQPFLEGTAPERSYTEQTSSEQSEQAARDDIF
jgi:penicillin-binding protein 1A